MTIRMRRARIAAMAMQAIWGNEHWMMRVFGFTKGETDAVLQKVASLAVQQADALIAELEDNK